MIVVKQRKLRRIESLRWDGVQVSWVVGWVDTNVIVDVGRICCW